MNEKKCMRFNVMVLNDVVMCANIIRWCVFFIVVFMLSYQQIYEIPYRACIYISNIQQCERDTRVEQMNDTFC